MPSLNYENAGALIKYEYLQGTITSIDIDNDTCCVSGTCGDLSDVPIFYHCNNNATLRSNGALIGSAGAFSVNDVVVVMVGYEGAVDLGKSYYVISHYDIIRRCGIGDRILFRVAADIEYLDIISTTKLWCFLWDTEKDDYAEVRVSGELIPNEDYPVNDYKRFSVLAEAEKGFSSLDIPIENCIFSYAHNLLASTAHSFDSAGVQVGDYVYNDRFYTAHHAVPKWAKVLSVAGNLLRLDGSLEDIATESGVVYIRVSSYLPLFFLKAQKFSLAAVWPSTSWYYHCSTPIFHPYTGTLITTVNYGRVITGDATGRVPGQHIDYVTGLNELLTEMLGSSASKERIFDISCGGAVLGGTEWNIASGSASVNPTYPAWSVSIDGYNYHQTVITTIESPLNKILYCNFNGDLIDLLSAERSVSTVYYIGYKFEVYLPSAYGQYSNTVQGNLDPIGDVSYNVQADVKAAGNLAVGTKKYSAQFYAYREYENNTFAQCATRSSETAPISTSRSGKLETAIKELITLASGILKSDVGINAEYYSAPRTRVYSGDCISILNSIRGSIPLLVESEECISSLDIALEEMTINGEMNHDNAISSGYEGGEILYFCLASTTIGAAFVAWMNSPEHASVILEPSWRVAGCSECLYPPEITEIAVNGLGYNGIDGIHYYSTPATYSIPLAYRGQVVCRGIRFAQ